MSRVDHDPLKPRLTPLRTVAAGVLLLLATLIPRVLPVDPVGLYFGLLLSLSVFLVLGGVVWWFLVRRAGSGRRR